MGVNDFPDSPSHSFFIPKICHVCPTIKKLDIVVFTCKVSKNKYFM